MHTVLFAPEMIRLLEIVGHAVAQLVEALRYKLEGHGFDSRWCHWKFTDIILPATCGPRIDSASNRNE